MSETHRNISLFQYDLKEYMDHAMIWFPYGVVRINLEIYVTCTNTFVPLISRYFLSIECIPYNFKTTFTREKVYLRSTILMKV